MFETKKSSLGRRCRIPHLTLLLACAALLTVDLDRSTDTDLHRALDVLTKGRFDIEDESLEQVFENNSLGSLSGSSSHIPFGPTTIDPTDLRRYISYWESKARPFVDKPLKLEELRDFEGKWARSRFGVFHIRQDRFGHPTGGILNLWDQLVRLTDEHKDIAGIKLLPPEVDEASSPLTRLSNDEKPDAELQIEVTFKDGRKPIRRSFPVKGRKLVDSISEVRGSLEPYWYEICTLTREAAIARLSERLIRAREYVTFVTLSVPKPLFGYGGLCVIYVLLFDLGIWGTADFHRSSVAARSPSAVSWSLLMPGPAGFFAVVLTIGILPTITALATAISHHLDLANLELLKNPRADVLLIYAKHLGWSTGTKIAITSGISLLSLIVINAFLAVRNDRYRARLWTMRVAYMFVAIAHLIPIALILIYCFSSPAIFEAIWIPAITFSVIVFWQCMLLVWCFRRNDQVSGQNWGGRIARYLRRKWQIPMGFVVGAVLSPFVVDGLVAIMPMEYAAPLGLAYTSCFIVAHALFMALSVLACLFVLYEHAGPRPSLLEGLELAPRQPHPGF